MSGYVRVFEDDCRNVLRTVPDNSIDSVVTDPPYALVSIGKRFGADNATPAKGDHANGAYQRASAGFMGKRWDTGETAFTVEFWAEILRVLKPGGHIVAFGGTRSYHRLACAIEDAGFEIRDQLAWCYGTGFPKSHDVSKAIDKAAGAKRERGDPGRNIGTNKTRVDLGYRPNEVRQEVDIGPPITDAARQWDGWGTALKPAWEPICLARKPLSEGTVAANVLRWGTGALNIDGCRVPGETPSAEMRAKGKAPSSCKPGEYGDGHAIQNRTSPERWLEERPGEALGRFPANLCHDGSQEVLAAFPETGPSKAAARGGSNPNPMDWGNGRSDGGIVKGHTDNGGSAARFFASFPDVEGDIVRGHIEAEDCYIQRFFYSAKASKADRTLSKHPTVKPVKLMQWLCRLITPSGGVTLDPFAGSGTTGQAAQLEGFDALLIEREAEYFADICQRVGLQI